MRTNTARNAAILRQLREGALAVDLARQYGLAVSNVYAARAKAEADEARLKRDSARQHSPKVSNAPALPEESVTTGLMSRDQLAADLQCGVRTVMRLEVKGMPTIRVGNFRFYDPVKVREWFLTHECAGTQ